MVSETRGASEAESTVDRHAVASETRGKRGRFTSGVKRGRVGSGMEGKNDLITELIVHRNALPAVPLDKR